MNTFYVIIYFINIPGYFIENNVPLQLFFKYHNIRDNTKKINNVPYKNQKCVIFLIRRNLFFSFIIITINVIIIITIIGMTKMPPITYHNSNCKRRRKSDNNCRSFKFKSKFHFFIGLRLKLCFLRDHVKNWIQQKTRKTLIQIALP